MNNVNQYEFWTYIQHVVNNLDNLSEYREDKWVENFSFKENLNYDIENIDYLLKNKSKINLEPIKPIKKKLG